MSLESSTQRRASCKVGPRATAERNAAPRVRIPLPSSNPSRRPAHAERAAPPLHRPHRPGADLHVELRRPLQQGPLPRIIYTYI